MIASSQSNQICFHVYLSVIVYVYLLYIVQSRVICPGMTNVNNFIIMRQVQLSYIYINLFSEQNKNALFDLLWFFFCGVSDGAAAPDV